MVALHDDDVIEWDDENPPNMGEDQIQSEYVMYCKVRVITACNGINLCPTTSCIQYRLEQIFQVF